MLNTGTAHDTSSLGGKAGVRIMRLAASAVLNY
jgi:hypothetical protein